MTGYSHWPCLPPIFTRSPITPGELLVRAGMGHSLHWYSENFCLIQKTSSFYLSRENFSQHHHIQILWPQIDFKRSPHSPYTFRPWRARLTPAQPHSTTLSGGSLDRHSQLSVSYILYNVWPRFTFVRPCSFRGLCIEMPGQ